MKPLLSLKSFKQQNLLLFLIMVVLGIFVYNLSIKRTLNIYYSYLHSKSQIALALNAPNDIENYSHQLLDLQQSSIQTYRRERLLENVTTFCSKHNLLIKSFPEATSINQNSYQVITNQIEVEGYYADMVQLVYLLEEKEKLGSVSSLKFYLYRDRIQKKTLLRGRIILRNLKT